MLDKAGEPICVARDAQLEVSLPLMDRLYHLASSALLEALAPLQNSQFEQSAPPTLIGLPHPRPGLTADFSALLRMRLQLGEEFSPALGNIETNCGGHSAGLIALEQAVARINSGQAEFCLAGGVDSYLDADSLEWLDQEEQLLSASNRAGFPPGEGAGFCLLTSVAIARRYKLPILAQIVAVATAQEKNLIKTETICIGEGLTKVFRQLTAGLKLPEEKINTIYCDMNGERYRNEEFVFTALRTQKAFVDVHDFVHPADGWGDVGAASGPLFAILAVSAAQRGYAKGPQVLLWTSSEQGQRCGLVLELNMSGERN